MYVEREMMESFVHVNVQVRHVDVYVRHVDVKVRGSERSVYLAVYVYRYMAVYVYRYMGAAARFVERAWRRHKAVSVFFG